MPDIPLLAGASSFLLDGLPNAAAAFSLRRLRRGYGGPIVRLRRSSDSAVQDFYPVRGSLNLGDIASFIGAGSGFIAKLYDQSGNGNDAAQATALNQPTFVSGVAALKGRPGILYVDAGAISLAVPSVATIDNIFAAGGTASLVVNVTGTPTTADRFFNKGIIFRFDAASSLALHFTQIATGGGDWTTAAMSTGAHVIDLQYSSAALSNTPTVAQDGAVLANGVSVQPTGTITSDAATDLTLGDNSVSGGIRGFPGHIVETIFFKSTLSAGQLSAMRANQKAYWGTP